MKHQHVKVAGAVCIAGALALTVTMVLAGSPKSSAAPRRHPASVRRSTRVVHKQDPSSLVATLTETTPDFTTPGGAQTGIVPETWYGAPSALPVLAQDNESAVAALIHLLEEEESLRGAGCDVKIDFEPMTRGRCG